MNRREAVKLVRQYATKDSFAVCVTWGRPPGRSEDIGRELQQVFEYVDELQHTAARRHIALIGLAGIISQARHLLNEVSSIGDI